MVRAARTLIVGLIAVMCFWGASAVVGEPPAQAVEAATNQQLLARAIYYQQAGAVAQRDLAVKSMATSSARQAELWSSFMSTWSSINNSMTMNTSVPSGLPQRGHVFVVLGSGLKLSGAMSPKFERRLRLAVRALAAYPTSQVLVTGGSPKAGKTEAAVGYAWLRSHGVAASRILLEAKSSSTIGNAKNTLAILSASNRFSSYSLISDSSHLRRASILFEAAEVLIRTDRSDSWQISREANVAFPDMPKAGQVPLSQASVAIAASNVATLVGVGAQYRALVAAPPKAAELTGLTVTGPTKATYPVGASLNPAGLIARAEYDGGAYSMVVTNRAKVTGFTSSTVGRRTASVSFTDGSITKRASFDYVIVQAPTSVRATPSTTRPARNRTRVVMTVLVSSDAKTVVPTGSLRFAVDGTTVSAVRIGSAAQGRLTYTFPVLKTAGWHVLSVSYGGNSLLAASTQTVRVKAT